MMQCKLNPWQSWARCILLLGLCCMWGLRLRAQPWLLTGESLPPSALENQRYYREKAGTLHRWSQGFWFTEMRGVVQIDVCHDHLVAYQKEDRQLRVTIIPAYGTQQYPLRDYICGDSLIFGLGGSGFYIGLPGRLAPRGVYCMDRNFNDQQVQGQTAWSVPLPAVQDTADVVCGELRHWGMLSYEGHWLIPPIYDKPIVFQNGVAEVYYYGQRRKINERGEIIDSSHPPKP